MSTTKLSQASYDKAVKQFGLQGTVELIVLITVRHAGAAYAWAVHDPLARKAGVSGDVVDAIHAKRKPSFTKPDEKAIYQAVTELLNTNKIGDAAYQALIQQFGLPKT